MERIYLVQPTMSRAGVVPEIVLNAKDADDLAEQIARYVKKFIASTWFDVTVDLDEGKAWIEGGRFGTCVIEDRGDFAQSPLDRQEAKA